MSAPAANIDVDAKKRVDGVGLYQHKIRTGFRPDKRPAKKFRNRASNAVCPEKSVFSARAARPDRLTPDTGACLQIGSRPGHDILPRIGLLSGCGNLPRMVILPGKRAFPGRTAISSACRQAPCPDGAGFPPCPERTGSDARKARLPGRSARRAAAARPA